MVLENLNNDDLSKTNAIWSTNHVVLESYTNVIPTSSWYTGHQSCLLQDAKYMLVHLIMGTKN